MGKFHIRFGCKTICGKPAPATRRVDEREAEIIRDGSRASLCRSCDKKDSNRTDYRGRFAPIR